MNDSSRVMQGPGIDAFAQVLESFLSDMIGKPAITTLSAMKSRRAKPTDAAEIARIYNESIEDGIATFETRRRTATDVLPWFDGAHPVVLVEEDGRVIAFAAAFTYRSRECYAGIAEFSVYVERQSRRRGAGRAAMTALLSEAERAGHWKLVSRVFVENTSSLALLRSLGFREVGIYEKHGKLDGIWRDVVIVEHLIVANLSG